MPHDYYAVFCKPRSELQAEYHLTLKGCETFMPRQRYEPRHKGKTCRIIHPVQSIGPLFPRYLFARGLEASEIHYTIGVSDLVRAGIEPVAIPEAVIERIRSKLDAQGILIPEAAPAPLEVGEWVEVTQGPLQGLISHITGIDNSKEVKIWCSMFGGAHVSVPRSAVARSSDPECGRISKTAA
jgi:transcriptional antiterminator RfaH